MRTKKKTSPVLAAIALLGALGETLYSITRRRPSIPATDGRVECDGEVEVVTPSGSCVASLSPHGSMRLRRPLPTAEAEIASGLASSLLAREKSCPVERVKAPRKPRAVKAGKPGSALTAKTALVGALVRLRDGLTSCPAGSCLRSGAKARIVRVEGAGDMAYVHTESESGEMRNGFCWQKDLVLA